MPSRNAPIIHSRSQLGWLYGNEAGLWRPTAAAAAAAVSWHAKHGPQRQLLQSDRRYAHAAGEHDERAHEWAPHAPEQYERNERHEHGLQQSKLRAKPVRLRERQRDESATAVATTAVLFLSTGERYKL